MWLVHSLVALSCCANADGAGFAVCGGECVVAVLCGWHSCMVQHGNCEYVLLRAVFFLLARLGHNARCCGPIHVASSKSGPVFGAVFAYEKQAGKSEGRLLAFTFSGPFCEAELAPVLGSAFGMANWGWLLQRLPVSAGFCPCGNQ